MPARREVLSLYKQLLRYGQQLQLTDKAYFQKRISNEFKKNKDLNNQEEITFNLKLLSKKLHTPLACIRLKYTLDYSLVPKIEERDLEEKFVRGSGPGGSAVNKNSNCVVLTHIPSGIVVKCHQQRDLNDNRKLARQTLITRLDNMINGDKSLSAQKKAIDERRSLNSSKKKEKLKKLQQAWEERFKKNDND